MRPTWAAISLEALKENYSEIKRNLTAGTQLMAVIKANAYGHGAVECARALETIGADWFGVALIEEGIELRKAGISRPVFCLGGFWQGQAATVVESGLTPALFRIDSAQELNTIAGEAGRTLDYHLKVDTGMGRLGVPVSELREFARRLQEFKNIRLDGVLTHFADADSDGGNYTARQVSDFEVALRILNDLGYSPYWKHAANSAGIHAHSDSHFNLARAGATLYGLTRDVLARRPDPFALSPVMSLHSKIIMLKSVPEGTPLGYGRSFITKRASRIATIPIGYADGLRRGLSNNGQVIVCGRLAPIVGRVSMDLTIVDVTDIPEAEIGSEVVLIGAQGSSRIMAEDMAERIGTISYEIVTGIGSRVPRIYSSP
jgi:alanine racemase